MSIDGWTLIVWGIPGSRVPNQIDVRVSAKMPDSPDEWLRTADTAEGVKFSKIFEGMQAKFELDLRKGVTVRALHDWFAAIPNQLKKAGLEPL